MRGCLFKGVLRVHFWTEGVFWRDDAHLMENVHASGQRVLDNGRVLSGQTVLIIECFLDKGHLVNGRHGHMGKKHK